MFDLLYNINIIRIVKVNSKLKTPGNDLTHFKLRENFQVGKLVRRRKRNLTKLKASLRGAIILILGVEAMIINLIQSPSLL